MSISWTALIVGAAWEPLAGFGVLRAQHSRRPAMRADEIREHIEVIGADGVHMGTVDRVEGGRIKLTRADSGGVRHSGHHHYIDLGLVAEVEGQAVRLSAKAAVAMTREAEDSGKGV